MRVRKLNKLLPVVAVALGAATAYPCSVIGEISSTTMVREAEAIVRATAVEYTVRPTFRTTGPPDSRIRFKINETIRGDIPESLVLPGYLSDRDDFNDQEPPYQFVRPGGRSGSCFANTYREGAEFLLFLKKTKAGDFTVNWYALGPVNEQLHGEKDPWLLWVRKQAAAKDPA